MIWFSFPTSEPERGELECLPVRQRVDEAFSTRQAARLQYRCIMIIVIPSA
jgi:hypothetical protein